MLHMTKLSNNFKITHSRNSLIVAPHNTIAVVVTPINTALSSDHALFPAIYNLGLFWALVNELLPKRP